MPITKQQIINRALGEIGVKENPPNSNKVKYNTWYYGKEVSGASYPWCMTFIQWLFKDTGLLPIKTASCSALYNEFKKRGQIVKDPQAGDIVFFKWDKSNYPCQHVGYVIGVGGATIVDVEGNTSLTDNDNGGAVMKRSRKRDKSIVAYARPAYVDGQATVEPTPTTPATKKTVEEIAKEIIRDKNGEKWGYGKERRKRLTEAGYDYDEVQKVVTALMKKK